MQGKNYQVYLLNTPIVVLRRLGATRGRNFFPRLLDGPSNLPHVGAETKVPFGNF